MDVGCLDHACVELNDFFFACRKHGIHLRTLLSVPYLKSWKCFWKPFGLELMAPIDGYTVKRREVFESQGGHGIQFTNQKFAQSCRKKTAIICREARPGHRLEIYNDEREASGPVLVSTQSLIESGAGLQAKLQSPLLLLVSTNF